MTTAAVFQLMGPCPCETAQCSEVGTKLTRVGHLKGCSCYSCNGKRNRKKGQAAEARRHKRLGGEGRTPRDELAYSYSLNITTEDKTGNQIPASFVSFVTSEWFRHALGQAIKKQPVGADSLAALYLETGRTGTYLVVQVPPKGLRG